MRLLILASSLLTLSLFASPALAQETDEVSSGAVKFRAGIERVLDQKYLLFENYDACTDCRPISRTYADWSGKKKWELTFYDLYAKRPKVLAFVGGKSYRLNKQRCLVRDRGPKRVTGLRPAFQGWADMSWDLEESGPDENGQYQLLDLPDGNQVSFDFAGGEDQMLMNINFDNPDQGEASNWYFEELLDSPKKKGSKYWCR